MGGSRPDLCRRLDARHLRQAVPLRGHRLQPHGRASCASSACTRVPRLSRRRRGSAAGTWLSAPRAGLRTSSNPPANRRFPSRLRSPMRVGVIGLGYVGLPLAVAFRSNRTWTSSASISTSARSTRSLPGDSYIDGLDDATLSAAGARINATTDYDTLLDASAVVICAPTPLSPNREPDLGPLLECTADLAAVLRAGQLVVVESTHLSRDHAGAHRPRCSKSARPSRRQRLQPRLFTRAHGPRPTRLRAAQHAEGRGRPD